MPWVHHAITKGIMSLQAQGHKGERRGDFEPYTLGWVAAISGGVLWMVLFTGHTFAHGSTQSPRGATILGFGSLDFYRLLAIPPLLFVWGWSPPAPREPGPVTASGW
jgi:hypothetical protein